MAEQAFIDGLNNGLNKLDALLVEKKISPEEYGKMRKMRAALVAKYQA